MSDIVNNMKSKPGFVCLMPASMKQIEEAENKLNLKFSTEYKSYVAECGAASFENHELTGVCDAVSLNVVLITERERINNPSIPLDSYVIEVTGVDGIIIWQNTLGEIIQSSPNTKRVVIAESLSKFIN